MDGVPKVGLASFCLLHIFGVARVRLDSVFTDPFGKSASSIMSYLVGSDPEDVRDEDILKLVDKRMASRKSVLRPFACFTYLGWVSTGLRPQCSRMS